MDKGLDFLSDYAVALSYAKLTKNAVHRTKMLLIDTLGCAMNAYLLETGRAVRRMCYSTGSPLTARVFGSMTRTTPEMAAFANAVMARDLDFNDIYRFKVPTHPSDAIPAMLAMAEATHANGKKLIESIVLSYEITSPMAERTTLRKGFDDCAFVATVGSSLGVGKILGLNKEQFANAVAFAVIPNMSPQERVRGQITNYKELYAGMACRQGIFAALLAKEDLTGPPEALEGVSGLEQVCVGGPIAWAPLGGDGVKYAVEKVTIKKFPVRGQIQIFIKTALDLKKKIGDAKDIKKLIIKTQPTGYSSANTPHLMNPVTRETADHSSPASVAIALIDGQVVPDSWIRERYLDKDVKDLIKKMEYVVDPDFSKDFPAKNHCLIRAELKSGATQEVHTVVTGATAEDDWTDKSLEAKYHGMVKNIMTPHQQQALLDILWNLEKLDDCSKIIDQMAV